MSHSTLINITKDINLKVYFLQFNNIYIIYVIIKIKDIRNIDKQTKNSVKFLNVKFMLNNKWK